MTGPVAYLRRWVRNVVDLLAALTHLTVPLAIVVAVTIIGTVGYTLLLDVSLFDGLYQAVITLSTVGFEELRPFDWRTKLFTVGLVFLGVGAVFYGITMFAATIVEGEVRDRFRRRIYMRKVDNLERHIILCGFGRVGEEISEQLRERNRDFVVVDQSVDAVERARRLDLLAVPGNAEEEEVLRHAGIERASGIIAATTSDASNTFITLTARALNPSIYIVARYELPSSASKLQLAGANRIISPNAIGARRMALSALQPMIADFMDALATGRHGDLLIAELEVEADSALDGRALSDAFSEARSTTVIGIRRADQSFIVGPRGGDRLQAGDIVILMAAESDIGHLSARGRRT